MRLMGEAPFRKLPECESRSLPIFFWLFMKSVSDEAYDESSFIGREKIDRERSAHSLFTLLLQIESQFRLETRKEDSLHRGGTETLGE